MKMTVLFATILLGSTALGQHGFTPAPPEEPPNFTQVNDEYLWVTGHWVGKDMTGPASSEISCVKKGMTCTDTQANITIIGGTFKMTGDVTEYTVERWTSQEIVATVAGRAPCHLRQVLKVDRVAKRISWMMALSEPLDSNLPKSTRDFCAASEMNLELKDGQSWNLR